MFYRSIALAAIAAAALPAQAINVGSAAFTYAESFDSLTTTTGTAVVFTNDSTLAGWSLFPTAGGTPLYGADNGGSNTGSFRSYGSTGSTERALGSLASGGSSGVIAVSFTNTSALSLAGFTLGYSGEQWRNGGNTTAQSLVLQYGFGSTYAGVTTWSTPGGSFDFTSPVATATAAALDGNSTGLVSGLGGSVATSWASGSTLWIRWTDVNDTGNDHGLAIDNLSFSVSAVPEPSSVALLLAGLGVVGFVALRRR